MLKGVTIAASIINAGALDWRGLAWPDLCWGIGDAVAQWATNPLMVSLRGDTTGAAGAGQVSGTLVVPHAPGLYTAAFASAGIQGLQAQDFATVISAGISTALTGSPYTGTSVGVAVGTDISTVAMASAVALEALLLQSWLAIFKGSGQKATTLAKGLSNGVTAQILLGSGTGVVTAPVAGGMATVGTSPMSWMV